MNGNKYLLDTCFIIQWHAHDKKAFELIQQYKVYPNECVYSDVTYAEVFGWHGITPKAEQELVNLLLGIPRLPISQDILECTIAIRRTYKIKLPDALILATAKTHNLQLLTLDEKLQHIAETYIKE